MTATEELGAELDDDDDGQGDELATDVSCPECGEDFDRWGKMAKARLGLHRKREHGIAGSGGGRRARKEPRAPRPRSERPPAAARGGRAASRRDLEEGTREAYESIGLMMLLRGDEAAARLIMGDKRFSELMESEPTREGIAGAAAKAWAKLAQHNETVEKGLGKTLSGGDWAELLSAHIPLLVLAVQRNPQKAASMAGGLAGAFRKRWKAAKAQRPPMAPPRPPQAPPPPENGRGYGYGPRVVPGP